MIPDTYELVDLEELAVLGVMGRITGGDDVGKRWEPTFTRRIKEIQALATIPDRYYGVSFDEGGFVYLAGMVVEPPAVVPEGLTLRTIPAGRYVRLEGPFHDWWMKQGPDWVWETWLPASPFEHHPTTTMTDFIIHTTQDWVVFYVPVRERAESPCPCDTTKDENPSRR